MNRRNALLLCGLSFTGFRSVAQSVKPKQASDPLPRRILVIGAGISGLAAAQALQAAVHEVVVIEARDRVGGRIWTSTRWPEIPLDLGASWIHGVKGNPLTKLADDLQARRLMMSYDSALLYDTSGKLFDDAAQKRLEILRRQLYKQLKKSQDGDEDSSVREVADALVEQLGAGPETRRLLDFVLSGEIEHEYSGSAEQLSAYWYDSAKAFSGDDALFAEGFHVVIKRLAENLRIETGQVVKEIHWKESPVRVVTDKQEFIADQVVVTLPLGVLKTNSVSFFPDLPKSKLDAIAALGMGVLNKCYLRFPRVFWSPDVDWLEYVSENHGEWTEWVSLARAARQPVLLGFHAGSRGREIEAMSDPQIVASAMRTLRVIYGQEIPEPIDYQITRWASDPFSRGSYSYMAVGSTPKMRRDLARPVDGKLLFAGEATHSEHYATAHGAYDSGLRVAKEMMK